MPEIKLPVTFAEFVKNKKDAITYMAIVAMVALFGLLYNNLLNQRKEIKEQLTECNTNVYTSRVETQQLRDQYIEVMGALKEIQGEVNTLKKLGIIK